MRRNILTILSVIVLTLVLVIFSQPTRKPLIPEKSSLSIFQAQSSTKSIVPPIADFKARITKKFFGTFVTPTNSPVSPERFTGFHTGVDVEYSDITVDVPVSAIADGKVITSETASGYGGVMVILHQLENRTLYAIYGHLRPASMLKNGSVVTKGEQIGVLGTAYSPETDGERRHLHFGITNSNTILGYVSNSKQLQATWIDPLSLYQ